ncbi:MAG TPA: sigma-54 dependent transcriptional regulator [Terriglobales bacterium]|nr:sigma-54 dependent transcriptional regulator [Terriglobales bacterium]
MEAVLVVDDEPTSVNVLRITLSRDFQVYTAGSGEEALCQLEQHPEIAVAIIDQRMPGMSGTELIRRSVAPYPNLIRIILTGYTDIDSLIDAINAGKVYRYLTKPWNKDELLGVIRQGLEVYRLATENQQLLQKLEEAHRRLRIEHGHLKQEVRSRGAFDEIAGNSTALQEMLAMARHAAANDCNVLILGETGTGKELVARAIHYASARAEQAYVTENCAAIAPDLLTSELFGHRKGAFTGAAEDRTGLFEVADRGTLFLDEIGDCSPELQVRLLRVLDQGEIRRVGDSRTRQVDVRIVAATHHDLEKDVSAGTFREDLFYRLNVLTIHVPPLRERREDIALLAQAFLERFNARKHKLAAGFTAEALAKLQSYRFPGNVRELENEVERAHALTPAGEPITPEVFSARLQTTAEPTEPPALLQDIMDAHEARVLREALERHAGNQTRAAAALGISRGGLIQKMHRLGLR